jgi:Large ribosomal RNA subunit accumulation protein YceD
MTRRERSLQSKSEPVSERGSEPASERVSSSPWSVPIAFGDVPETGRHLDLVADAQARAAIAELAGLAGLPRLDASFDVTLDGRGGLRVAGRVSATAGQTCVVTLEPMENEIDEAIDLVFEPATAPSLAGHGGGEVQAPSDAVSSDDPPERLVDGAVDLGAIATEFLLLGIDPYPRKPGAVFQTPAAGEDSARPFAPLAALASEASGQRGHSIVRAPDTRPDPSSSARAALASEASGQRGHSIVRADDTRPDPSSSGRAALKNGQARGQGGKQG